MASASLNTGVYNSDRTLSPAELGSSARRKFYLMTGGFVLYGLLLISFVHPLTQSEGIMQLLFGNAIARFVFMFIVPVVGTIIVGSAKRMISGFLGYNLVVVPYAILLAVVVQGFDPGVVQLAGTLTAAITVAMSLLGIAFPATFSSIWKGLFLSLLALVVVMLGYSLFASEPPTVVLWAGVGIFALFIGYDMGKASVVEPTPLNALKVATQMYLNIINLFMLLLRIFSRK